MRVHGAVTCRSRSGIRIGGGFQLAAGFVVAMGVGCKDGASELGAAPLGPGTQHTTPTEPRFDGQRPPQGIVDGFDLEIAKIGGGDIEVSWDSQGVSTYEVWTSSDPYFTPGDPGSTLAASGSSLSFVDEEGTETYYRVRAPGATEELSTTVGQLSYDLYRFYTKLGLCLVTDIDTWPELDADMPSNPTSASIWNASTQSWIVPPALNSVVFGPGEVISVQHAFDPSPDEYVAVGHVPTASDVSIPLYSGDNLVSMVPYRFGPMMASDLLDEVPNATRIGRWDAATQTLYWHPNDGDWVIPPCSPVHVDMSAAGTWPPPPSPTCGQHRIDPPGSTCGNSNGEPGELCYDLASTLTAPDTTNRAHLVVADFDADGDLDILAEDSVFLGDGTGAFASPIPIPQVAGPVALYAAGLTTPEFSAGFVGIVRSEPTEAQPDVRNMLFGYTIDSGPEVVRAPIGELGKHQLPRSLAVGDFDEDDYAEFAIEVQPEHGSDVHVSLFELDDGGELELTPLGPSAARNFGTGILPIDSDADGDLDLLVRSALLRNDGANDWERLAFPTDVAELPGFFATHFDCAGLPDAARVTGMPFRLYEVCDGGCTYSFTPTGDELEVDAIILAAGLLNEDEALDLLVANEDGTFVLLGDGPNPPSDPISLTNTRWRAAAVADLDHDGRTEIIGVVGDGHVYIWEKDS